MLPIDDENPAETARVMAAFTKPVKVKVRNTATGELLAYGSVDIKTAQAILLLIAKGA